MDREAFRKRFKAYKEGKPVSEIYDAGLPRYAGGKRGYIGGSTKHARETVWNTDQTLSNAVDSIANAYLLKDGLLLHRLNEEGFTDKAIRLYNNAGNQSLYTGENLLNNKTDFSGVGDFGLDDAGTMILNNQMLLKGENWWDEEGENEQGRITHGAVGDTVRDTIGLQASALKYFSDQVKKDYPNLSDYDNARYTQAYYQRGVGGGRKWAKAGAKGYNFSTKPLAMRPAENPYLIQTTIQNTAAPKFGKYANGKLPGYKWGTREWDKDDSTEKAEQWADDWKSRVTTSRVLKEWNKTGIKPKAESSKEYTDRRIKEETKRTWLSDAADISHGIGEAVIAMDPYTAIPYFGSKIGTDVINGNVGMHTALDAAGIAGNWLFNYVNPNSLLNLNIRTALYNNKIPYSYNLFDIDIPKSIIEGSIQALRGNKILQLAKPKWFGRSGNILGYTGEESVRPLTEMHQNHRAAAWARYLGLDDTLLGVGYIPSRKNWVTKAKDPYFENAYKSQVYQDIMRRSEKGLPLNRGVISDKSVYNTAGGMGYEINPSTGVARIFDVWDLLPFKKLNIPILKNFEASQILPGAKPFNFETFISIPK